MIDRKIKQACGTGLPIEGGQLIHRNHARHPHDNKSKQGNQMTKIAFAALPLLFLAAPAVAQAFDTALQLGGGDRSLRIRTARSTSCRNTRRRPEASGPGAGLQDERQQHGRHRLYDRSDDAGPGCERPAWTGEEGQIAGPFHSRASSLALLAECNTTVVLQ